MIVQIVIVIVTAVQVNSQELCPSVCKCDGEQAACTDLFSDVTDMTQHRLHAALKDTVICSLEACFVILCTALKDNTDQRIQDNMLLVNSITYAT
jgi:hypothetical protein